MKASLKRAAVLWLAIAASAGLASAQSGASMEIAPASSGMPQTSSQNPFTGSVTAGQATSSVLPLSLADAIQRGLKQNLGAMLRGDDEAAAKGNVTLARSPLLPNLSARVSENAAQVNLAAEGFGKIVTQFPGFPLIVGPFGYFDARAYLTQTFFDKNALDTERAAALNHSAAQLTYRDAREVVVLIVGQAYLQAIAASAHVDTAQAQVNTAQALFDQASDRNRAGLSPGIDRIRAQVELQAQQQELIAARNDFAKQKLALARAIGLPLAQQFTLTDTVPYQAPNMITLDEALKRAYAERADYQGALSQVRAAELSRHAATAEHLPSLTGYADYGVIGPTPASLHGTFTAFAALRIPIFAGNHAHADALIADASLTRSRQLVDDLRGQIEQQVRTAMLDLQSSSDLVQVSQSNVDLAQQTLTQAQDRFNAGATDNIEVVQAQEALARANQSYISSLYSYNLARIELARATGSAERGISSSWKE